MINDNGTIPCRQTMGSAGYDFYANEDMHIGQDFRIFDTGVRFDGDEIIFNAVGLVNTDTNEITSRQVIFRFWVGFVHPRSSLAIKKNMQVANIGVIDQDYRDTIKIAIRSDTPFTIKKGDRYAQLIFVPIGIMAYEEKPTKKREGGIGSTDNKQTKLVIE